MENKCLTKIDIDMFPQPAGTGISNIDNLWKQFGEVMPEELRSQEPQKSWGLVKEWLGVCNTVREGYLYDVLSGICPKPVLFICCDLWMIGGIERVMTKLTAHFSEKYQIILMSLETGDQGYEISEKAVSVKLAPEFQMSDALRAALLAKILNTDIFLGNANQSADFLPVYELLKQLHVKSVMMNHCHYLYPYKWECFLSKAMKIRKDAVQYADVVLFLTEISAALCRFNGRSAGVMPNANAFETPEDLKNLTARKKNIIAVGRFNDPVKRVDKIFETFAEIYRTDPDTRLILVGKYDPTIRCDKSCDKNVGSLLAELEIPSEAVVMAGETIHVENYYRDARVLLFASECEGFGLVLNEAAVFGVPTVAYYYSGIEDIITDGENGFIVGKEETDKAAQRIAALLEDDELFRKMSKDAILMAKRFEEDRIFEKWECVFETLMSSGGTREELEEKLSETGILKRQKLSKNTLENCISEYGACVTGMTERICRCDDLLELLHAQYVSAQAENEELKAKLQQKSEGAGGKIAGLFRHRS